MRSRRLLLGVLVLVLAPACQGAIGDAARPGDDDGQVALSCPVTPGGGALVLDGANDYVTMGRDPAFELAAFTIEAWVRRDGDGVTMTSGAGGLRLTPIASKGLGEGDGSNIDANYAFGFWGDVLGADFEDMASGKNHPVFGRTAIPRGEWHHVAATYDGATWRLYVDGVLDGEATVDAAPRADSVHPFVLGSAVDSAGVPHGFFHGALDEVRLWNRARTAEEIADGRWRTIAMGEGLVARWALDAGGADPTALPDSVAGLDGAIVGEALVVDEGVILDHGEPPIPGAPSPADGAATGLVVELDLPLELAARAPVDVTYHVRELTAEDDFTIVVLPDTQYYTLEGANDEQYFYAQTQWVRDHRRDYNIVAVLHNGDLINNLPQDYQWRVADKAMSTLETPEDDLPDGVPYGIVVGNHDNANTADNTAKYNSLFGVARFAGRAYYGGHYGSDNDEHWFTFSAGGLDVVVVDLQYNENPDPAVLAWARSIFLMHPDAFGILNTHYLIGSGGNFGVQGKAIYEALKDVRNVQLMTCGHVHTEKRRADTFEGHTIHTMLADYQDRENHGGLGFMRIWEFSPARQTVTVRTYSPAVDQWQTDPESEFTLDVNLRGSGASFRDVTVAGADPGHVAATIDGLEPGTTYEWYATIESCGKTVETPLYRFTTGGASMRQVDDARHEPPGRDRSKRVRSGAVHPGPDDPALED
jgi:hypothetical protein